MLIIMLRRLIGRYRSKAECCRKLGHSWKYIENHYYIVYLMNPYEYKFHVYTLNRG